jgi:type I restriction-modification system DNA methylase subunit
MKRKGVNWPRCKRLRRPPEQLAKIAGFIWGIADDVLRDLYVRGKYRDVILPMTSRRSSLCETFAREPTSSS